MALFVARAEAVGSGFALTVDNAAAVADLCRGLDGLPLAIELAAGRTRVLSPEAMCARLDDRLRLLSGGPRDRPARHQTMRDSLQWSYELLEDDESALLRVLAMFVCGFTLSAAEAVGCAAAAIARPDDVGLILDRVVAHGFIRPLGPVAGGRRFALLETVREFALERLGEAGEIADAGAAMVSWVCSLAERAGPKLDGPDGSAWLERLDAEHGNIVAVLQWCLGVGEDAVSAVQIITATRTYWDARGYYAESRMWLSRALEQADVPPSLQVDAHNALGVLAWRQDDYGAAQACFDRALAIAQRSGSDVVAGRILGNLGIVATQQGRYDEAVAFYERSLALLRASGDQRSIGNALNNIGATLHHQGQVSRARPYYDEALACYRNVGDERMEANVVENVGMIALEMGDEPTARTSFKRAHVLRLGLGDRIGVAVTDSRLAVLDHRAGRIASAAKLARRSIVTHRQLADTRGQLDAALVIAFIAGWPVLDPLLGPPMAQRQGPLAPLDDLRAAARITAACVSRLMAEEMSVHVAEKRVHDDNVAALRAALGRRSFAACWATGLALDLDGAVEMALGVADRIVRRSAESDGDEVTDSFSRSTPTVSNIDQLAATTPDDGGLTPRELEVAALVAAGLMNTEIAARLHVSVKAIEKHMGSIRAKLDARNRRDVALWARAHGLGLPAQPPAEP